MLDELSHGDLRLEHILLRHVADRVLDPRRFKRLTGDCNLLVMHPKLIGITQQVVKCLVHLRRNALLRRFEFRFCGRDSVVGDL